MAFSVALFFFVSLMTRGLTTPLSQIDNAMLPEIVIPDIVDPETIGEGSTEGDILIMEGEEPWKMQRKATPNTRRLWPADSAGVIRVPYVVGSDIEGSKLEKAIDQWRDNTCITFDEVTEDFSGAHIIFEDSSGCSSFIGLVRNSGQEVRLHESCVSSVGPAVHEIGHALGFYHEQSRSDRDEYVDIYLDNVESGKEGNFDKHSTNNYDVPYDFSSIMHYGATFFSSNGKNTVVAKPFIAQTLIGNRKALSFMDIKLANKVYKCTDSWLERCRYREEVCRNEGFTGRDCTCVCPPGTSGSLCQVVSASYTDAIIKNASPHSEVIKTPGTVSTPGYPVPILEFTKFVKILEAPTCHQVRLTMNNLHIYPRSSSDECTIDYLTIYVTDDMNEGTTYCGKEITRGTEFVSSTAITLEYKNYNYASIDYNSPFAGFTGEVTHERLPNCVGGNEAEVEVEIEADSEETSASTEAVFSAEVNFGDCSFEATNSVNKFFLRSPGYPERYLGRRTCALTLTSTQPRTLTVTPTEESIGSRDWLAVTAPGGVQHRISTDSSLVLSANARISFGSGWSYTNDAFSVAFEAVESDCHEVIELDEQETGSIVLPSTYSAQTYCEWWIKAPEGKKIQLEWTKSFSVGTNTNTFCALDKLVVDLNGNTRYETGVQLCGQNAAMRLVSYGTQLNVLFRGLRGGSASSEAFYSVV